MLLGSISIAVYAMAFAELLNIVSLKMDMGWAVLLSALASWISSICFVTMPLAFLLRRKEEVSRTKIAKVDAILCDTLSDEDLDTLLSSDSSSNTHQENYGTNDSKY